jgi:hypothetical protein
MEWVREEGILFSFCYSFIYWETKKNVDAYYHFNFLIFFLKKPNSITSRKISRKIL